jgi:hypothetical protein
MKSLGTVFALAAAVAAWALPTSAVADCCDLAGGGHGMMILRNGYYSGTYYNGYGIYYGPRAYLTDGRTPYVAPVRIHAWPVCYFGGGDEVWDGYHWVGSRIGFCD